MNCINVGDLIDSAISEAIKQELGMTVGEFSERAGIPASTLYKILSGERNPKMETFRRIVCTIREIEGVKKHGFIAVIASRGFLDNVEMKDVTFGEKRRKLKEYAVTNMEDAIIAGVQAEKDGAAALVCAPICSPIIEKITNIPVATIRPRSSVIEAIKLAAKKSG